MIDFESLKKKQKGQQKTFRGRKGRFHSGIYVFG